MTDLDERLTLAFADLFAENRSRFRDGVVSGGPGYYGVRASAITADASEVGLVITFRAGVRYCCYESGCHVAHYDERWWGRLRGCLDRHGLAHLPLPLIRSFRGVIERGAVMQPGMVDAPDACFVDEGSEYETGPWPPLAASQAAPASATDPPLKAGRLTDVIKHALRALIGLPLWAVGRAGSLEWFQFGGPRTVATFRGGSKEVGEYALHLDCPWRLVGPSGLVASDESEPETLARVGVPPLACEAVAGADGGGATIRFEGGWLLAVSAGSPDESEFWRLFRPGADVPHFVVGPAGAGE